MDNLFQQGKPLWGRFNQVPDVISLSDFNYQSPFGRPITGIKKHLAFKRFQFISLNHANLMIGLAIVDLGWVGHGFFYAHDMNSKQTIALSGLQPLAHHTHVSTNRMGKSYFKHRAFNILIQKKTDTWQVNVKQGKHMILNALIDGFSSQQPLSLCSPTGVNGWTYTHKNTGLTPSGQLYFNHQVIDLKDDFLVGIDESCGMLRHETAWHWLFLNTKINGKIIGLNLAMGVNETAFSENSMWINGQIFELPPVLFTQTDASQWHVHSQNQQINLYITTDWVRQEAKNFIVVASQFKQWVALISGDICINNQTIHLEQTLGLLEQHYAKW